MAEDDGGEEADRRIDWGGSSSASTERPRFSRILQPMPVIPPYDIAAVRRRIPSLVPRDPLEVEAAMRARGVVASARGPAIRLAPHFYSTLADVELALDALSAVLGDMAP